MIFHERVSKESCGRSLMFLPHRQSRLGYVAANCIAPAIFVAAIVTLIAVWFRWPPNIL
jgi:hypothetical protein